MADCYIIPVFVPHKGCPHDCVFCNQKKITGHVDSKSLEREITASTVKEILSTWLSSIHEKKHIEKPHIELSFFGGSFTAIPLDYQIELLTVAKDAKDHGVIDAIRLSTRPDCISQMILDHLKAYGVDIIELGVQSMDDMVLEASERGHTSEDVKAAVKLIKEYGFTLGLQMMIGLPMDSFDGSMWTATALSKLKPDFVRIYPTLVIKSTKLESDFYSGSYVPLTLKAAVALSKQVYMIFLHAQIPIIRLGLQATEQISLSEGGDIVAGPFHPAFRELVEGSLLNDLLEYGIHKYFPDSNTVQIEISPKDISKLYADKKFYFSEMINNLSDKTIYIRQNNHINRLSLRVFDVDKERILSLYEL